MLVVVGPVPVLVPVEVAELEVGAAVAGREESFASVYNHEFMVSDFCLHWSVEGVFRESRVSQRGSNPRPSLKKAARTREMLTVYAADRPVTFLQIPEGVIEPATKLTVEHCQIRHQ